MACCAPAVVVSAKMTMLDKMWSLGQLEWRKHSDQFHFSLVKVTAEPQRDAREHLTHVLPSLVSLNTYG